MDKAISSIPEQLRGVEKPERAFAEQVSGFVVDSGKKDSNSEKSIVDNDCVDVMPPSKKTKIEGSCVYKKKA